MAVARKNRPSVRFIDKDALRAFLERQDAQSGFTPDPDATPEKVRALMLADGIRPEENVFSRELMRMRYEDRSF